MFSWMRTSLSMRRTAETCNYQLPLGMVVLWKALLSMKIIDLCTLVCLFCFNYFLYYFFKNLN